MICSISGDLSSKTVGISNKITTLYGDYEFVILRVHSFFAPTAIISIYRNAVQYTQMRTSQILDHCRRDSTPWLKRATRIL